MKIIEINLSYKKTYLSRYKEFLIIANVDMYYDHSVGVTRTNIRKHL